MLGLALALKHNTELAVLHFIPAGLQPAQRYGSVSARHSARSYFSRA
jgi:hypothetical protein